MSPRIDGLRLRAVLLAPALAALRRVPGVSIYIRGQGTSRPVYPMAGTSLLGSVRVTL